MFPGFSVCLLCVRTRTVIVSELVRNVHTSVLISHGWGLLPLRGHIVSVTDKRECREVPRGLSLVSRNWQNRPPNIPIRMPSFVVLVPYHCVFSRYQRRSSSVAKCPAVFKASLWHKMDLEIFRDHFLSNLPSHPHVPESDLGSNVTMSVS